MSATLVHGGLPAGVRRIDLLSLVEDLGKRGLGLSSTATRVLRHYVWRSRDDDYRADRICAVWDRVCRTADDLDLCSRAINDAERELEAKGLIVKTTGGNGARSGLRSGGIIRWAAGINLAPLIERYTDLKAAWAARELEQQAIDTCKAEIRRMRRLIRNAAEPQMMARADAILPDGRVALIQRIEKLQTIRTALEAVLADLASDPRAMKTSDRPEENCRPNIQNQDSSRSCSGRRAEPTITPRVALELASDEFRNSSVNAAKFSPRENIGSMSDQDCRNALSKWLISASFAADNTGKRRKSSNARRELSRSTSFELQISYRRWCNRNPTIRCANMRAWILSDLHIEQSHWDLPDPQPDYDVLIAAGDVHDPLSAGVRWLAERSGGRPVIYVPGNHEWYAYRQHFTIQDETLRAQDLAAELGVNLLLDSAVTIDGVRFLGSTLWTDSKYSGTAALECETPESG